ncbi:MAG: CoA transferase [Verrucomicrobiota bacterium]|nr:CoA transferase [Verrucomicrobiota bacterium]
MLSKIKILDISRVLAGPLCTMTLGDLGAMVLKIERPKTGDETRGWGPPFDTRGESAYYLSVNRNKLSVACDLDLDADTGFLLDLMAEADVVVDNFRPGTLEKRGIDPDKVLLEHPWLIWCTITGFGAGSTRPGYDLVVQAESGWMSITGEPDGPPMRVGVALADIIAGKDATIAILAALAARGPWGHSSLTPANRRIHISLSASATAALINVAQNSLVTGRDAARWGNQHPNLVPYQLFDAADRPFVLAVGADAQWPSAMKAMGLDELAADTSLATNAARLGSRDEIIAAIAAQSKQRSAAEWVGRLEAAAVPCGVVKTVVEALQSVTASPLTGIAPSVPGSVRFPPPRLDEHGEVVRRLRWRVFDELSSKSIEDSSNALH